MRPPSNPSEISPDPTFDPSRNISGRKRIRFPDESTTDTPTRKNSSCFSRDGKICDVKTTGRGTGAVPMAAVRQNKVNSSKLCRLLGLYFLLSRLLPSY